MTKIGSGVIAEDDAIVFNGTSFEPVENGFQHIYEARIDRDLSTATNTVAYTGLGFKPKIMFANSQLLSGTNYPTLNTVRASFQARVNAVEGGSVAYRDGNITALSTSIGILGGLRINGGQTTFAHLNSMDADGFTLYYEQIGVTTGELRIRYVALG